MQEIRLLTLWQPWASLVAEGLKRYETRSWPTDYRGLIAIHAAKRPIVKEEKLAILYACGGGGKGYTNEQFNALKRVLNSDLPLGEIVAIVENTSCLKMVFSGAQSDQIAIWDQTIIERAVGDWHPGRFAFQLENILKLPKPFPFTGSQGLRRLDEATIAQINSICGFTNA